MRESPSIPLITALQDMGATVRAFDPVGMEQARIEMPDIQYSRDPYECADGADALVIVTEWEQFRALDLDRLKREMACPVVIDLRNIYDPNELTKRGFLYQSIGRASLEAPTQGSPESRSEHSEHTRQQSQVPRDEQRHRYVPHDQRDGRRDRRASQPKHADKDNTGDDVYGRAQDQQGGSAAFVFSHRHDG